jgi:hypothetical protein
VKYSRTVVLYFSTFTTHCHLERTPNGPKMEFGPLFFQKAHTC